MGCFPLLFLFLDSEREREMSIHHSRFHHMIILLCVAYVQIKQAVVWPFLFLTIHFPKVFSSKMTK